MAFRSGILLFLLLPFLFLPAYPVEEHPSVQIGVFSLLRPTELTLRPYPGSALILQADRQTIPLESGQSARFILRGKAIEYHANGQTVMAGSMQVFSSALLYGDFLLGVPAKIERRFQGNLRVLVENGMLVPVIEMDRETAVASAVAAESPPGASREALKAQAVTSRSYYAGQHHRHASFQFCDTTHCQYLREPPEKDSPAAQATQATQNLVLTYRGKVVPGLFSASCGGTTRTLAELGMRQANYPYFSVQCRSCQTNAPRWENRLPYATAARLLSSHRIESARIAIGRSLGWKALPGNNFSAHQEGQEVVVRGQGRGHGLGLCQEGAAALARKGWSYETILRHYFPNTTLLSTNRSSPQT